jgi:hypothetical protein
LREPLRVHRFGQVNPLFPALRFAPMALSGASRQKQIPSSQPIFACEACRLTMRLARCRSK